MSDLGICLIVWEQAGHGSVSGSLWLGPPPKFSRLTRFTSRPAHDTMGWRSHEPLSIVTVSTLLRRMR